MADVLDNADKGNDDHPGVSARNGSGLLGDITPADSGPVQEAVRTTERIAGETNGLGRPGRPMNRRSPFFVGMTATAGTAVTVGAIELLLRAGSILTLIGMALFIAIGLDSVVGWLAGRRVPRWLAVIVTLLGVLAIAAAFLALAIPRITAEATALVHQLPHYAREVQNHNSELGELNARYQVESRLSKLLSSHGTSLAVLSVGEMVIGAVSSFVLVAVLSVYFLGGLPRMKLYAYRLVPASRRSRTILLADELFRRVGGYVLGNALTSVIAGEGTGAWMLIWGIPVSLPAGHVRSPDRLDPRHRLVRSAGRRSC